MLSLAVRSERAMRDESAVVLCLGFVRSAGKSDFFTWNGRRNQYWGFVDETKKESGIAQDVFLLCMRGRSSVGE